MIPKRINFFWGGEPLSYLQYLTAASFKKHNPNWELHLFSPKEENIMKPTWNSGEQTKEYVGENWLSKLKEMCIEDIIDFNNFGLMKNLHTVYKSDFIRWYILHEYGGVWSDLDILYIKPIDVILNNNFDSAIVFDGYHHIIGFYITKPKQQIFNDVYNTAKEKIKHVGVGSNYQIIGSRMLMAKYPNMAHIHASYKNNNIINLPMSYVYPYGSDPNSITRMFFGEDDATGPETIGIHWYNGSNISKEYINNMENYKNNKSKISQILKEFV